MRRSAAWSSSGSVLVGPLEKRVFSSLWPFRGFFFLFVARVSSVSELTGSVAKKKSCNKKTPNWKNSLKNWTFGRIFLRKWRRFVKKWSGRWLASPILLQGGMTLEYVSDRRVRFSDESIQGGFSVIGGFLSWTSPVMTKSRSPSWGRNNYPENGLVNPPRRDTRALSPAGMFGGKAPPRLAVQKSRPHAHLRERSHFFPKKHFFTLMLRDFRHFYSTSKSIFTVILAVFHLLEVLNVPLQE